MVNAVYTAPITFPHYKYPTQKYLKAVMRCCPPLFPAAKNSCHAICMAAALRSILLCKDLLCKAERASSFLPSLPDERPVSTGVIQRSESRCWKCHWKLLQWKYPLLQWHEPLPKVGLQMFCAYRRTSFPLNRDFRFQIPAVRLLR